MPISLGLPPAYMGFVGFMRFPGNNFAGGSGTYPEFIVRATSLDLMLSQEIDRPDVVDSRYDRTVYRLMPFEVGGSFAFPAIFDRTNSNVNPFAVMYRLAVERDTNTNTGTGLLGDFDVEVKYSYGPQNCFVYNGCAIDSWQFGVAQGDMVNMTANVIGITRTTPDEGDWDINEIPGSLTPDSRVVTWNDAVVKILGQTSALNVDIGGQYVRNFECNISNNIERFYTLNGCLFPQAIAPQKREVDGNMVLLGRHPDLAQLAYTNQTRCYETTSILFGFDPTQDHIGSTCEKDLDPACRGRFLVELPNIVFMIEEMSLSNDLFETTVNWICLPGSDGDQDPLRDSIIVDE